MILKGMRAPHRHCITFFDLPPNITLFSLSNNILCLSHTGHLIFAITTSGLLKEGGATTGCSIAAPVKKEDEKR
jgi:hypothetical protein